MTPTGAVERREITCPVRVVPGEGARVEPEVRREMLLLETARAREEALERERQGDHRGAAASLQTAAHQIRTSYYADDARLANEAADLEVLADSAFLAPMSAMDKKYLFQRAHEAGRGRREAYKKVDRPKGPTNP